MLLLSHPELLDLKLAAHAHDLVKSLGEGQRIY